MTEREKVRERVDEIKEARKRKGKTALKVKILIFFMKVRQTNKLYTN